jgi:sterol desaturase/sphingolipid hydroxylase (fatty acid hydroxylase superfamily)
LCQSNQLPTFLYPQSLTRCCRVFAVAFVVCMCLEFILDWTLLWLFIDQVATWRLQPQHVAWAVVVAYLLLNHTFSSCWAWHFHTVE